LNIEQIEKEREMKERPILFSGEMVRAILDDRKTMTRRVVKPQPEQDTDCPYHIGTGIERKARICPYGKPGDRLWVRETFCDRNNNGEQIKPLYRSDGQEYEDGDGWHFEPKWKPSIFMPRMYSRITLEITNVRVERLQDISEEDSECEGISSSFGNWKNYTDQSVVCQTSKASFRTLWESINGPVSWGINPWVWVVEFKRVLNG
jgi:hypothetical protein